MTILTITTTCFDVITDEPQICGRLSDRYIFHPAILSNKIIINGIEHDIQYQNGNYLAHDYNCVENCLKIYEQNTSAVIVLIDKLYESDFDNLDYINEVLEEVKELETQIDTIDKLLEVYSALCDNEPTSVLHYLEEGHSFDIADYDVNIIDEEYNEISLSLKKI